MPQRSPIFHRQPQYATNIISDMHIEISPSEEAYREDIDMCSRCDIFVLTLIAHISLYLTDTLSVLREYLNILRIPPEFSAVQCISFFRFGRVSYYAFHTYHTNIGNILLDIEKILYMLPRIAKISHIGGKVTPELGEIGLSSLSTASASVSSPIQDMRAPGGLPISEIQAPGTRAKAKGKRKAAISCIVFVTFAFKRSFDH